MCGRYVVKNPVTKTSSLVKSAIQVEDSENYNAHPYQKLPVIKKYKNGNTLESLKWGLVPSWAKNKEFKALINARLEEGAQFVRTQQLSKAIEIFTEVIKLDQNWAEAWNKRATVFYLIGEFKKSQDDIDKVLAIEARHFGALAGQGLVNIQLKNYEKAILSYEQAKEIHPSMQSPEIMIRQIEELIKQQSI